jgi:hypothetical protein
MDEIVDIPRERIAKLTAAYEERREAGARLLISPHLPRVPRAA